MITHISIGWVCIHKMGENKIIVDHLKLEYSGVLDVAGLINAIDRWMIEHTMEKKTSKLVEQETPRGKFIEWEIAPWTKATDYVRLWMKIRTLMYDLKKVNVMKDGKKVKLKKGRILIVFDGYLEFDYESRWQHRPMYQFIRTMFDKFIYKVYTERFERQITYMTHDVYHYVERYLNMYKHYRPVSKMPHFYH